EGLPARRPGPRVDPGAGGLLFDRGEPYRKSLLVNDLRRVDEAFGHVSHDGFYAALLAACVPLVPEIAEQPVEREVTHAVVPQGDQKVPFRGALEGIVQGGGALREPLGKRVFRVVCGPAA